MIKITKIVGFLSLVLVANASTKCAPKPTGTAPISIPEPFSSSPISNGLIYGFAYNAKHSSGQCPDQSKVDEDLEFLKKHSSRIRTYGLIDCNQGELTIQAAYKNGVDIDLGMWLGSDINIFYAEFGKLKELIQKYRPAFEARVKTVVVGSETLLRRDQTYESLINRMAEVKNYLKNEAKLPNIKVTTGEVSEFWENRGLQNAADYVFLNFYPYFEGVPIENAINRFFSRIHQIKEIAASSDKEVVISETGWPEGGSIIGGSIPSLQSQFKYNRELVCRSKAEGLKTYMFSAFDEAWKPKEEDSNWGVFKAANTIKPGFDISC